jgi:hypothetical protein
MKNKLHIAGFEILYYSYYLFCNFMSEILMLKYRFVLF